MSRRVALITILLMALLAPGVVALAQAAPPSGGEDALAAVEAQLKEKPGDPALLLQKVDLLMARAKYLDARACALGPGKGEPPFRYRAAVCTFKMGMVDQVPMMARPLYGDATLGRDAYALSARALVATGKEAEAKALVAEACAKFENPGADLLRLSLFLDPSAANGAAVLPRLGSSGVVGAEADGLAKLFAAAGAAGLRQETLEGSLPATVTVSESKERHEVSTLNKAKNQSTRPGGGTGPTAGDSATPVGSMSFDRGLANPGTASTMQLSSTARPVVPAQIGSLKTVLVFDTAVNTLALSSRVAEKLGLTKLGAYPFWCPGMPEAQPLDVVLVPQVKVGPVSWQNVPAVVLPEDADFWKETGGVLPVWMLRHYGLRYDRRHGQLQLFPPGTPAATALPGGSPSKCLWLEGRLWFDTRLQDRASSFALAATAVPGTYLEMGALPAYGIVPDTSRFPRQTDRGHLNIFTSTGADEATLWVGNARITMPAVRLAELCPPAEVERCATVGRSILDLFDFYWDYSTATFVAKGYDKNK